MSRDLNSIDLGESIAWSSNSHCLINQTLVELVPIASKPHVAVIVLTQMTHRGVWKLAKQNGAYACLTKKFTSGKDLDRGIRSAVAFVGQMPKEDRYRNI